MWSGEPLREVGRGDDTHAVAAVYDRQVADTETGHHRGGLARPDRRRHRLDGRRQQVADREGGDLAAFRNRSEDVGARDERRGAGRHQQRVGSRSVHRVGGVAHRCVGVDCLHRRGHNLSDERVLRHAVTEEPRTFDSFPRGRYRVAGVWSSPARNGSGVRQPGSPAGRPCRDRRRSGRGCRHDVGSTRVCGRRYEV